MRPVVSGVIVLLFCASVTASGSDETSPVTKAEEWSIGLGIGFVPGDSFFAVAVPEESLEVPDTSAEETVKMSLEYSFAPIGPDEMTLPINHGFTKATVVDMTARDILVFNTLIDTLYRDTGDLRLPGEPKVVLVNADFDWNTSAFFIRYNEKWKSVSRLDYPEAPLPEKPGADVFPHYYHSHVGSLKSVVEDWENGATVRPLDPEFPDSLTTQRIHGRPQIVEPVSFRWKAVKFLAFPGYSHEEIFARKCESVFYVCSKDGISRFRWTNVKLEHGINAVLEWTVSSAEIEKDFGG
jgi:hypothetical protein